MLLYLNLQPCLAHVKSAHHQLRESSAKTDEQPRSSVSVCKLKKLHVHPHVLLNREALSQHSTRLQDEEASSDAHTSFVSNARILSLARMFADICHAIKDITVPQFAVGIQRMTRSESNILFNCWNGQKLGLRHSPGPRHHQRQQPGADPPFPHRPRCPSSIHSHQSASTCLLLELQRELSTSTVTLAAQGRKSLPRPAVTLTCYCSPPRSSDPARVERGRIMPLV